MLSLNHHNRAARVQVLLQSLHHLRGQTLLHLRAASIQIHHAGELAQTGHLTVRAGNVTHMRHAVERHQVVLTGRVERDVLHQHHLGVGDVEGRTQNLAGILVQAREELRVGTRHTCRGLLQAVTVRVLTNREQNLADGSLNTRLVDGVLSLAHSLLHSGSGCCSPGAAPEGRGSSGTVGWALRRSGRRPGR